MADLTRANLLDFDRNGLRTFFAELGEKAYRADQVMKWIYHRLETDFEAMTDLGKPLRERLAGLAVALPPRPLVDKTSSDGTRKWLLGMDTGNAVETVFIPEPARGTLCVSSQIGCALNCTFCATGAQGFNRNLATSEIIGQVWHAAKQLEEAAGTTRRITNVVMMGMGEPLLNFDNVVRAISLMRDDLGFGLASKRVTLSTAGVVPKIDLLGEVADVSLAVSLHAPNDELRTRLMPINKRWGLDELLAACARYARRRPRATVTFEYTLMKGVNDSPALAKQLIKLMQRLPAKVNLIPFNPFPGTQYQRSDAATIDAFRKILMDGGVQTMVRRTRGEDIDAACGQLRGRVADRTRRHAEFMRRVAAEPEGKRADAA